MKTLAYLRMSSDPLEMQTQKQTILAFAQTQQVEIPRFIASNDLWRKEKRDTKVARLLELLQMGDTLVVSDLCCMGRSVGEIVIIVDTLVRRGIRFIAVNERIDTSLTSGADTPTIGSMFSHLAQIEKELISRRTKEGLAKARAKGKKLGRPKGSFSPSRLDRRRREIKKLLALSVSKASIAKITGVSQSALAHYIKSRKLA
jgi:DNA invertase Pin-like site-specific DNA recombinase